MTTSEEKIDALKKMIRIRRFEQLLEILFKKGEIRGTLHLAEGQEAAALGVNLALNSDDIITTGHRFDHILIARGVSMKELLADIIGVDGGINNAAAGGMHLFSQKYNLYGTNGIVAASIPISVGIAWAQKQKKSAGIVATFFGEGATTEGSFHEAMNMASVWGVPLLLVCENNQYAQTTALSVQSPNPDHAQKIKDMYKIESAVIDGNDLEKVIAATVEARQYVEKRQRPFFLELKTYRFSGHSINDTKQTYKAEGEVNAWHQKDPIKQYVTKLMAENTLTDESEKQIEQEILIEINDALKFVSIA